MSEEVRIAFEQQVHVLPLRDLLPSKMLAPGLKESVKYKRIAASVASVGLVEPLVVARQANGSFLVLDGHVRLSALRDQSSTEARCVIADDDEGFTYNKRVNRLATIQEHYMIVRALERGVSEAKLARALNVDVKVIRQRRSLLAGIAPGPANGSSRGLDTRTRKPPQGDRSSEVRVARSTNAASRALACPYGPVVGSDTSAP